jgi:flagellar operon protein
MSHYVHNPAILPPDLITPDAAPALPGKPGVAAPGFQKALAEEVSGLKFSGHAIQRIERRGIDMGAPTLVRLEAGVARAASKGSRDSVVFVDGTAFVVSVRNKTVITAVDSEHMREHVFTNIDSAVIA